MAMYHSSTSSCRDGPFLVSGAAAPFVDSGASFLPSASLPLASSCPLLARGNQLLHRSSPPLLHHHQQQQPCYGAPLGPSCCVLRAGDLVDEHPRAVVRRYSAGERRERVEKYRSKRSRRNFQKKITYAGRKMLADSRRRVKGRFACDGNLQAELEITQTEATPTNDGDVNNINVDGSSATGAAVPEWWPAMQEALAREEAEVNLHLCDADDKDMLAAYLGVSSVNL